MVAVLLLLAILPSAAAVTSPMSAAILESTLRDARVIHVQRERPNPLPSRAERVVAARVTWGAEFGTTGLVAAGRGTEDTDVDAQKSFATLGWQGWGTPPVAARALAMVRGGEGCLAPPLVG